MVGFRESLYWLFDKYFIIFVIFLWCLFMPGKLLFRCFPKCKLCSECGALDPLFKLIDLRFDLTFRFVWICGLPDFCNIFGRGPKSAFDIAFSPINLWICCLEKGIS